MMTSDYIFVRQCPNKDGSITPVAYALPEYYPDDDGAELIHKSTSACHASLVDVSKMKKKRYIGVDVLYGVN
jgi:hypothetical protein